MAELRSRGRSPGAPIAVATTTRTDQRARHRIASY